MKLLLESLIENFYFEGKREIAEMIGKVATAELYEILKDYNSYNKILLSKKFYMTYARIFKRLDFDTQKFDQQLYYMLNEIFEEDKKVNPEFKKSTLKLINSTTLDGYNPDKNLLTFEDFLKDIRQFLYQEQEVDFSAIESLTEGEDYNELKSVTVSYSISKNINKKAKYRLFIPLNYEASKLLASKRIGGCLGDWCVAYPNNDSHWNDYTSEGKILVYAIADKIDTVTKLNKLALVSLPEIEYGSDFNSIDEIYNQEDGLISIEEDKQGFLDVIVWNTETELEKFDEEDLYTRLGRDYPLSEQEIYQNYMDEFININYYSIKDIVQEEMIEEFLYEYRRILEEEIYENFPKKAVDSFIEIIDIKENNFDPEEDETLGEILLHGIDVDKFKSYCIDIISFDENITEEQIPESFEKEAKIIISEPKVKKVFGAVREIFIHIDYYEFNATKNIIKDTSYGEFVSLIGKILESRSGEDLILKESQLTASSASIMPDGLNQT